MIIVLKQDAPDVQVREFCHELEDMGLQINDSKGSDTHILGLIGDTKAIAESWVLANPVVETCRRVSEPYKKANRKFHPDDSVIDVDGVKIGGKEVKFEYTELEENSVDVTLQVYKMATLPVDVNFINAPRDFDDSMLVYALSRKQLKVAGPADKIDMLSTLPIGNIDLSTFTLNKSYELPIDLPADIYLLDNISTITVSFDCSNLGTKTMNLPNTCVQVVNLPSTYQLTVQTERLMNVTLCGPKGAIETLTPEQVVIEIDADDFYVAAGQQNIACRLYVPSNGKIFALGSYVIQCKIESN